MMADSEGGVNESQLAVAALDAEDHAELPVRGRQVDLDAMRELGSVGAFLVAGEKNAHRHPVLFVLAPGCASDVLSSIAGSLQILGEGRIVEQRGRMTSPLVAHWLPLAVGGLHWAELGLELSQSRRLGAKALADRLKRRIRNECERSVRALLGDAVLAHPVVAELDVSMQLHAVDDGRSRPRC
jgi:hypothetical protein